MKRLLAFILAIALLAAAGGADDAIPSLATHPTAPVAFVPMGVFIDPHGKALACYQIEIVAMSGDVKLVGVEGGESDAFNAAPYYDVHALQGQRIVIGAYSLGKDLPSGKTRVATLMIRVAGTVEPKLEAHLAVAASADAVPIAADVSLSRIFHGAGAER